MNTHGEAAPTADERIAARLTDLLDGELDDAAAAELDALLDDEATRAALDDAREGQALLQGLTRPAVPRDFLRKVQRRVRRRSGGRYFHPAAQPFGYRISVEVFIVVAVVVMAGCWMIMEAGRRGPPPIVDDDPSGVEIPTPEPPPSSTIRLAPPVAPAPAEPAAPAPEEGEGAR